MIEPAQQAISVELDFVDPVRAFGRLVCHRGKLRRLALRQLRANRAFRRRFVTLALRLLRRRCALFNAGGISACAFRFVVALDQQPIVLVAALHPVRA